MPSMESWHPVLTDRLSWNHWSMLSYCWRMKWNPLMASFLDPVNKDRFSCWYKVSLMLMSLFPSFTTVETSCESTIRHIVCFCSLVKWKPFPSIGFEAILSDHIRSKLYPLIMCLVLEVWRINLNLRVFTSSHFEGKDTITDDISLILIEFVIMIIGQVWLRSNIITVCQVWKNSGGNSGNSRHQVQTYEMSEGTSASAYVLHPFQTLVPRFQNEKTEYWRSDDWSGGLELFLE